MNPCTQDENRCNELSWPFLKPNIMPYTYVRRAATCLCVSPQLGGYLWEMNKTKIKIKIKTFEKHTNVSQQFLRWEHKKSLVVGPTKHILVAVPPKKPFLLQNPPKTSSWCGAQKKRLIFLLSKLVKCLVGMLLTNCTAKTAKWKDARLFFLPRVV